MSYYKRNISADTIYHVINRGVDKRKIFLERKDYLRFIHDMYEFNDEEPASTSWYRFRKNNLDIARPNIEREKRKRQTLVDILAFCLMPNHYHLLLKPKSDRSLTIFVKKLNMGYAKYFNEKNGRSGALFQGRFKSVPVVTHKHFIFAPFYIHLNPLDLIAPEWRNRYLGVKVDRILNFLGQYRWSSHLDYCGDKNFPSVIQKDFLNKVFGGHVKYKREFKDWLIELPKLDIGEIIFE